MCLKGPRNLNDLNLTESTSQNDVGIFLRRDTRNIFYVTKRNVQEDFMARVKKSLHQSRSYLAGETFPGQYTPTRNLVPEPRQRRKAWFFVEADRSSQPVSTHPELISFLKKKRLSYIKYGNGTLYYCIYKIDKQKRIVNVNNYLFIYIFPDNNLQRPITVNGTQTAVLGCVRTEIFGCAKENLANAENMID